MFRRSEKIPVFNTPVFSISFKVSLPWQHKNEVGVDRGLTSSSDNRGHYSGRGEDDKDITLLNSYHHKVSHGIYSTSRPIM